MIRGSILFVPRVAFAVGCVAVILVAALPLWWLDTVAHRDTRSKP